MKLLRRSGSRSAIEVEVPIVWADTLTTSAAGSGSLVIPAGIFTAKPVVSVDAERTAASSLTGCDFTAVINADTSVTVTVYSYRSPMPVVNVLQPMVVTAATVHVMAVARRNASSS